MDEPRLIGTTDTAIFQALQVEGSPVVAKYDQLVGFLKAQGREDLAGFFAEPVPGVKTTLGFKSVSWYSPLPGQSQDLDDLVGADRVQVESILRGNLRGLQAFISHPEVGPLLSQALVVPTLSACKVIFGKVVLTDWGFAPTAVAQDMSSKQRHWAATLGPYAGFDLVPSQAAPLDQPPSSAPEVSVPASTSAVVDPGTEAPAPSIIPVAPPPVPPDQQNPPPPPPSPPGPPTAAQPLSANPPLASPPAAPKRRKKTALFLVLLLLLLLLLALTAWLRPTWWHGLLGGFGSRIQAGVGLGGQDRADAAALELQLAVNRQLEDQIARMEQALADDVCASRPALDPPMGTSPPRRDEGEAVPPAQASRGVPGDSSSETGELQPASLAGLLEASTVMVVAVDKEQNGVTGTAFFVAPGVLLTNRHVVENADPGRVFVTSKALGGVHRAVVLATGKQPDRDYAILKIAGPLPPSAKVLKFSDTLGKLDNVVAAGFPALITADDPMFKALVEKGDHSATPELVFSRGEVAVILDSDPAMVAHTAIVSGGNSGGPLVDKCGRVVGINTMIKLDQRSLHQSNYALGSGDIIAFLKENGVEAAVSPGKCRSSAP